MSEPVFPFLIPVPDAYNETSPQPKPIILLNEIKFATTVNAEKEEEEPTNTPQTPENPPAQSPETGTGTPEIEDHEGVTEDISDVLPKLETETPESAPSEPETPLVQPETISTTSQQPSQPRQSWWRRLFGGGSSDGGGPKKPEAKNGGFLSNLFSSKWARRLALTGLIFRGGSHAEGRADQDVEPKNSNFGEIGSMVIEGLKDNIQHRETFENFVSKLKIEKAKAWQEVTKNGTVGADNNHNRLIAIFKNQLKNRPGLLTEAESSESINDLAERIASEAKLLTTGLNHEAINNLVVGVQRNQKTGNLVPAYFDTSGKSLSFDRVSDSYFYNTDSNLDAGGVKVSPEIKPTIDNFATENYAGKSWAADALLEHKNIVQKMEFLGSGAQNLSSFYNAYEHALKNWLLLAEKTTPLTNDDGAQLSHEQIQLINQDIEALAQLNQAAQNLKISIRHQELAKNPMGNSLLHQTYEKAFKDWGTGISQQITDDRETPEPTNFLERQLEEYAKLLESDQRLERQNQDFSEKMNRLDSENTEKNLKNALKRVYARYLVAYQVYENEQQQIFSDRGFSFNPERLPKIQQPVETVGVLLEDLLFLDTCDKDFPKKLKREKNFDPDFKQKLANYLVARENLKRMSPTDTKFRSLVTEAASLGVELQLFLLEQAAAEDDEEAAAEAEKK
ncbi:MAG: hypothetical protein V1664_01980 [Candidatus Uhrbacteria bacterium]